MASSERIKTRALLLVLGDLGRSPRMQLHALALARQNVEVDLIGYADNPVYAEIAAHPSIHVHYLAAPVRSSKRAQHKLLFIFDGLLRTLHQAIQILRLLRQHTESRFILVQNPPAIPTLAAVWLAALLRRQPWFIDWHNFADSILALKLGKRHWIVRLAGRYERFFAHRATGHLCVSNAMREVLSDAWGIGAEVVHDRPLQQPQLIPLHQQHMLLLRLQHCLWQQSQSSIDICTTFRTYLDIDAALAQETLANTMPMLDCTQLGSLASVAPAAWADKASLRSGRSALLVSSSSWTADDDPGLILEAARLFDQRAKAGQDTPHLIVLMTGKGQGLAAFERALERECFHYVHIFTAWLHADDYRLLLASADLGISLHRSSSGVDLPIKVIDMLGEGLPVATYEYHPCVHEQITVGHNALTFISGSELGEILWRLFSKPPAHWQELDKLKAGAETIQESHLWDNEWARQAAPLLLSCQKPPIA